MEKDPLEVKLGKNYLASNISGLSVESHVLGAISHLADFDLLSDFKEGLIDSGLPQFWWQHLLFNLMVSDCDWH